MQWQVIKYADAKKAFSYMLQAISLWLAAYSWLYVTSLFD